MKKLISLAAGMLWVATLLPSTSLAHLPTKVQQNNHSSLAPMLASRTPAVVNITVEKTVLVPNQGDGKAPEQARPPLAQRKALTVGSGVVINAQKGYIITNAHVISHQKVMMVTLKDGRRYHARLVGKDDNFDIAVIQIHAKHLKAVPFGQSDQLKVGDFVVAIGSPFGLTQTVTSGIISALNRDTPHIEGYQNFIQTDAPINPGNSGGALLDLQGRLVGINTAIIAPNFKGNIGIGFAIPSNMAKSVAEQLIKYGKVSPGILGVFAQNITPELADALALKNTQGVLVTQVVPGGPASKAGVKAEDIILAVNKVNIRAPSQLRNVMGIMRPGTSITLTVSRQHQTVKLNTRVGNPNTLIKREQLPFLYGLRLRSFHDLEPTGKVLKGVFVMSVADNSAGALAGLLPGDVILTANNKPTTSISQLVATVNTAPSRLLLKVARANSKLYLVIQKNAKNN